MRRNQRLVVAGLVAALFGASVAPVLAQAPAAAEARPANAARLEAWRQARFGMFFHLKATEGPTISEFEILPPPK